ncbi:MAG TPA: hypothetical protein VG963_08710 [Polyangiaceae bacterium]|nr:hypothetical protein [Polyangiaceae bacterium]
MLHARRIPLLAVAFGLLTAPARADVLDLEASSAGAALNVASAAGDVSAPPNLSDRNEGRQLGGHTFLPVVDMVGPFATTSFGTFLTVGAGSTKGSLSLQLPGSAAAQIFSGNVSYAAVGGVIGYEYSFLRDFAARVVLSETLYSGTTGTSAAVVGTNARLGGDVGLTGGFQIGQSLRISGVFDASYVPRIGLLIGPAIESAFNNCAMSVSDCKFDFGQLFSQQNILALTPGVAAAWALLPALGLTANVSYSYAHLERSGSAGVDEGSLSFGAALDLDLWSLSAAPVGLQAIWNTQVSIAGPNDLSYTDLGGGLFYTGRKDLSVGLQVINRRFRVVPDVDVSWGTVLALTGLRYYWR